MSRSSENALENLISGSEALIRDLEVRGIPSPFDFESSGPESALPPTSAEPSTDGIVDITVSKDEMIASATFHAPTGNGKPLTFETVVEAIAAKEITIGVDWEAIQGCMGQTVRGTSVSYVQYRYLSK